jgi:hypothetical protein
VAGVREMRGRIVIDKKGRGKDYDLFLKFFMID